MIPVASYPPKLIRPDPNVLMSNLNIKCNECEKLFASRANLGNHVKFAHSSNKVDLQSQNKRGFIGDDRVNNIGMAHRQSYTNLVKLKAVQLSDENKTVKDISILLNVPYQTLSKWLRNDASKNLILQSFLVSKNSKRSGNKSKSKVRMFYVF